MHMRKTKMHKSLRENKGKDAREQEPCQCDVITEEQYTTKPVDIKQSKDDKHRRINLGSMCDNYATYTNGLCIMGIE